MKKLKLLTLLILFIFISPIFSQETINTDRPNQTESSLVIPKSSFQIESGFGFLFQGNKRQISAPNSLFRYGLFSFLELRFFNEVLFTKDVFNKKSAGISDLQFGIKVHLIESENSKSNIAFLSHIIAPSGNETLSANRWGSMSRFLFSHQLTNQTSLSYNLGYQYLNSKRGDLIYTLSCGHNVTNKFALFIEVYGDLVEFEKFNINGDAGMTYLICPNLQLDASYGLGFNQKFNYLNFGVCWNVALKPPSEQQASN